MRNIEVNRKRPLWVTDPYTKQTYDLEPLFDYLRTYEDYVEGPAGIAVLRRMLSQLAEIAHENFSYEPNFEESYKDIIKFNHMLWVMVNTLDKVRVKAEVSSIQDIRQAILKVLNRSPNHAATFNSIADQLPGFDDKSVLAVIESLCKKGDLMRLAPASLSGDNLYAPHPSLIAP